MTKAMSRFILRNLLHYWRTNLAVMAGVATAVAVLSGALLVGQSVRASLRDLLFERLGATGYVVAADRFFREDLAAALSLDGETGRSVESCPIIHLRGVLTHEGAGRRAHDVNVYGIDDRFWQLHASADQRAPEGRTALVGAPLAEHLGVRAGDGLLLRIETGQDIPRESLYGRRESVGRTIRLECGGILPANRLGEFALRPAQGDVFSIFVPLKRLQSDLDQPSRANAVLLAGGSHDLDLQTVRRALEKHLTLDDVGVRIRRLSSGNAVAVESTRVLLDGSIALAAFDAAADAGMPASGVFTYLANAIRAGGRELPYSAITAADLGQGALTSIRVIEGTVGGIPSVDASQSIWLNEWAWRDLGVSLGEDVEVDYYRWEDEGRLAARTARFRLAGVVSIGGDIDATLAPRFPGITEARSIRAWDPPFPLDLRRIRPRDEQYWSRHQATPKAFVTLARGQELWESRFGKLTAVRTTAFPGLEEGVRSRIGPESAGFTVTDVRARAVDAARGSVDLGEYFIYFSFFLIAAAILLSALFFRLGIEQRAREVGTLQAVGFPKRTLRRIFLLEGAALSLGGSLAGVAGAVAYGGVLVLGLRTWWVGASGTHRLYLHVAWEDLALGAAAGVVAALGAIVWTLRDLQRNSPRALLSGVLESGSARARRARVLGVVSMATFLAALLVLLASAFRKIPDVEGFFGAGSLLLVSMLSVVALYLRRADPGPISGHGWSAFVRLGARNATHRPARSLLCVALIASATFIIVSVEAFRKDDRGVSLEPGSGTGGYALLARAALPVVYDPNSAAGREALGIPHSEAPELADVTFVPFRERPGDDASCLNLYAPQEPTVLGASPSFVRGGRFSFAASLASSPEQKRNPWLLLESASDDGAVPAIGDANTIQYILNLSVGAELTVRGSAGAPVRLRLVAALRDSILQGELVVSEENFLRAFPGQEGYRFFLLDVPAARAASLVQPLTERLADWGFRVESTRDRLAAYHQVENTYLSTFQSLGVLGLLLGTAGLAAVLLRNVLERRGELALLRAVGYRKQTLSAIIVVEHLFLMACGLACGTVCAILAIMPASHARGGSFPVAVAGVMLAAVLTVGLVSSCLAAAAALRAPLLDALRSE